MDYSKKIVLITGGAGGLGRGFAKEFLARGAKVCIADFQEEAGVKALNELQSEFPKNNVTFVNCDVTNDDSFKGAFATCKERLGAVNVLINNAGCNNEQNWKLSVDVNIGGCIRGTELGLQLMGKHTDGDGGNIINIASVAGVKAVPFGPVYSGSKAAIVHYSRCAGDPFHVARTGVQIQSLCPSFVKTPFLVESLKTPYTKEVGAVVKGMLSAGKICEMEVEDVTKAMIKLMEEGKPGASMVVEFDKDPYYVGAPLT